MNRSHLKLVALGGAKSRLSATQTETKSRDPAESEGAVFAIDVKEIEVADVVTIARFRDRAALREGGRIAWKRSC